MEKYQLELFYFDACPFCMMVNSFIKKYEIQVNYVDTMSDPNASEKLMKDTGKRTVPCLYINGKPMHESSEIMKWLEKNLDQLPKAR